MRGGDFSPANLLHRPALYISDFHESRLNPHSYNLRLGDELLVYDCAFDERPVRVLDMRLDNPTVRMTIPAEGLVLEPGVLYLGHTVEVVGAWGLAPKIDGRSSVGRLGLMVHLTAGYGDSGFCGQYTLELSVVERLRVYPGVAVCQVSFETVAGTVNDYDGKYAGQSGPVASRLWKELAADSMEGK